MPEPSSQPRPIPARAGIGLRAQHHAEFLRSRPDIPWVEVHSENFFADGGRQIAVLDDVRRDYALSLHGVGLSLGSADPLDREHLRRLRRLVNRTEPALVSEHVAWSSVDGLFVNDLLPMPLTGESLSHLASRIIQVQDLIGRRMLVENVSSYVGFTGAEMTEWEFLAELAARADCFILLDVNNIYVNACNHHFDARRYIDAMPAERVAEYHVAGHTVIEAGVDNRLLVDTHDAPVADAVWSLYETAIDRIGRRPTLLEWDTRLPTLTALISEARIADERVDNRHALVA